MLLFFVSCVAYIAMWVDSSRYLLRIQSFHNVLVVINVKTSVHDIRIPVYVKRNLPGQVCTVSSISKYIKIIVFRFFILCGVVGTAFISAW
jgi:hypothetical protein